MRVKLQKARTLGKLTAAWAICAVGVWAHAPVGAQSSPSSPSTGTTTQCAGNGAADPDKTCTGAGNPINVVTGNKYQREVDLPALPGVLGLEVVRHYNSSLSRESEPNGILGKGWRLGYEYSLYVIGNTYQIIEPDGQRHTFARSQLDPNVCVSADPMQGRIQLLQKPGNTQYIWILPSGRQLRFGSRGQLEEIRVPSGEFLSLQYDVKGRLSQVTDPQGRALKIKYHAGGKQTAGQKPTYKGIASIETPVGEFSYQYGSALPKGSSAAPAAVLANLVSVNLPKRADGTQVTRQYFYEDAKFPTLLTGLGVQSQPAHGKPTQERLATYRYDSLGRARRSEHGSAVELTDLQLASPLLGAKPGRVVLVHSQTPGNPKGYALEVLSQQIAGEFRITQTRGVPCPVQVSCPAANVRYQLDDRGHVTEVLHYRQPLVKPTDDGKGKGWSFGELTQLIGGERYDMDGQGRVTRRWVVQPAQGVPKAKLVEELAYDGLSERVAVVRRPSVVAGQWHEVRTRFNDKGQPVQVQESGWRPALGTAAAQAMVRSVSYAYKNINGRSVLASVDGPLAGSADTTQFEWDDRGSHVQRVKAPLSLSHRFERDMAGRVTTEVPSDGVPVQYGYLPTGEAASWQRGPARVIVAHDALARPTRIDMPDGEVQKFGYEPLSGAVAAVRQDGAMRWVVPPLPPTPAVPSTGMATAQAQRLEPQLPQPWQGQKAWLDDFGQLVGLQTAVTGLEVRHFDAKGRILERKLADGTVWRWQRDVLGRIVRHEASKPREATVVTTLAYDGVHLVRVQHPQETELMQYDQWGRVALKTIERPATTTQPAQRWSERFAYDPADRLTRHELPEGGALTYTWGPGQQLQRIDMEDGRLSAVLGQRMASWLGAGRQTLIAPLPDGAQPVQASASGVPKGSPAVPDRLQAERDKERGYQWGNGVAMRWRLNAQGQMASMRYSAPAQQVAWWQPVWQALPMAQAEASPSKDKPAAPSWLDWTYTYDAWGRLQNKGQTHYAYDALGRLLVSQHDQGKDAKTTDFYAYDKAEQGGRMVASREQGSDHDWREAVIERTASGLPQTIRQGGHTRTLRYSADNRLVEVSQDGQPLARYGHNTHGQRISKQLNHGVARTFLWSQGQLAAEGSGQDIERRYVYARGVPVAAIDHLGGASAVSHDSGAWSAVVQWAQASWRLLSQPAPQVTYLHGNEIGTPVAATNASGRVVWQAEHSAFGALRTVHRPGHAPQEGVKGFELNLRLPGQYFDEETGWHDNVLRTYDPQRGEYLEPDPLGPVPNWSRGAGPWLTQPFAYANHNPITYADPTGLILFAFDGTGNSDPAQEGSSLSNVQKFFQAYDRTANGERFYITGIGTTNEDMSVKGSEATGTGFRERLDLGTKFLEQFINTDAANSGTWLDVDVVGFSRGAAEARAWVSEVEKQLSASREFSSNNTGKNRRCINFRFLGVWDTVPHLGANHGDEKDYDFSIPASVKLAAHAVAVNEHRGGLADFDVESIHANATVQNSSNRIERGFVGAHSDIGGGYAEGDLSDVALMWMIQSASTQGIAFDEEAITNGGWNVVSNPIVHDSRIGKGFKEWLWADGGDREMVYINDTRVKQESAQLPAGVTNTTKARESIQYFEDGCGDSGTIVGLVDVAKYKTWVSDIGVTFESTPAVPTGCVLKK